MKEILLVMDGLFHPSVMAIWQLIKTLKKATGYNFTRKRTLEKLPEDLDRYSALLLFLHHKSISNAALKKLITFVSNGGGLLGIHSATASFKQSDPYFELLGGRFVGHGKIAPIKISGTSNIEPFPQLPTFTIHDELYHHDSKQDITVHFQCIVQGEKIPVVWTRIHDRGRVCYLMPGHTSSSFKHPSVQKIFTTALDWVSAK